MPETSARTQAACAAVIRTKLRRIAFSASSSGSESSRCAISSRRSCAPWRSLSSRWRRVSSSSTAGGSSSGAPLPARRERRPPRRQICTWPLAWGRVTSSAPMRRSIQDWRFTLCGRSAALQRWMALSWPASARTGGSRCCCARASRKASRASRRSSSAGRSSSSGRPSKKSLRASMGSRPSRASGASGPSAPSPSSSWKRRFTSGRAAAVRCTTSWPLRSGRSSSSAPMRRSIQSRRARPCGRSLARACWTVLSLPTCERFASSLLFQVARKSKIADRSCSSSGAKDPAGSESKKASRRSSFPAGARRNVGTRLSSKTWTSPPMRLSTHFGSKTPRGRQARVAAITSGSLAACATGMGPFDKNAVIAARSFSSSGLNESEGSPRSQASGSTGGPATETALGLGSDIAASLSGSAT
mmetsp:Transcript_61016/g.147601  ORF Transcript_61016/g.147601 Transcript_61016/m.147601 type:complete len:416 (-) Transcript_61016:223-1470(-)